MKQYEAENGDGYGHDTNNMIGKVLTPKIKKVITETSLFTKKLSSNINAVRRTASISKSKSTSKNFFNQIHQRTNSNQSQTGAGLPGSIIFSASSPNSRQSPIPSPRHTLTSLQPLHQDGDEDEDEQHEQHNQHNQKSLCLYIESLRKNEKHIQFIHVLFI